MANQIVQLPVIQWEEPKPKYTPKATPVAVSVPASNFDVYGLTGAVLGILALVLIPIIVNNVPSSLQQPTPITQTK